MSVRDTTAFLAVLLSYFAAAYCQCRNPVAVDPNPQKGIGYTSQPNRAGVQIKGQAVSKNETDAHHAHHAILYAHTAAAIEGFEVYCHRSCEHENRL